MRKALFTAVALYIYISALPLSAQSAEKPQLDTAIHDYILAHPEVVLESVKAYDARVKEAAEQKVRENVRSHLAELTATGYAAPSNGEGRDQVTVVEFFDYRCGFCKKSAGTVAELEKTPGVKVIYKELPILGNDSLLAAQAALAAEKQGGYQTLHDLMLASDTPLTEATIDALSIKAGLDLKRLKQDMSSPEVNREIAANEQLAEKLSIQATPTFVVGDQLASGALTKQAFLELIAKSRGNDAVVAELNQPKALK